MFDMTVGDEDDAEEEYMRLQSILQKLEESEVCANEMVKTTMQTFKGLLKSLGECMVSSIVRFSVPFLHYTLHIR